jgi:hypothetical protein
MAAGHAAAEKEVFCAVRRDELQVVQDTGRIVHRHDQLIVIEPQPVGANPLCSEIRMVRGGIGGAVPYFRGPRTGLRLAFLFLLLLLAFGLGNLSLVGRDLFGSQFPADVRPPCLINVTAPTSKGTGNVARVQNVPSSIIAAPAVAREAVQLAIRFDQVRRLNPCRSHGLAKLHTGETLMRAPPP